MNPIIPQARGKIVPLLFFYKNIGLHCVVANVLDCDIVVSEFEHQSDYHIHFRTNTPEKGINPRYSKAIG